MRVSFDLDDTVFVSPENFKTEAELTIDLMKWIQEQGIELTVCMTYKEMDRGYHGEE